MRILGIDPGYALLGYGVIDTDGRTATVVDYGVVETKAGVPFPERLQRLYDGVAQLIEMYRPDCAVFEELFFYHNITTAISVGAGRGGGVVGGVIKAVGRGVEVGVAQNGDGIVPRGVAPLRGASEERRSPF